MINLLFLAAGALLTAAAPPASEPSSRDPLLSVRQGPLTITADRAEFERDGRMLYRGHVRLVSGPLELSGEQLDLRQSVRGQYEARVSGNPARLIHTGPDEAVPVSARANEIVYDTRSAIVDLNGDAQLERGTDRLNGDTIRYDAVAQRINASGVNDGQIKLVIQPPGTEKSGDVSP
ncbi:MAG: lipopolysaccharide transport periplasmic protein LptA [Nevskiales bacterium]|nr:lipopolysaccharide transport periplasmic protein LptA [Nevskiales bacterium]